jgi:hypothetical protein
MHDTLYDRIPWDTYIFSSFSHTFYKIRDVQRPAVAEVQQLDISDTLTFQYMRDISRANTSWCTCQFQVSSIKGTPFFSEILKSFYFNF